MAGLIIHIATETNIINVPLLVEEGISISTIISAISVPTVIATTKIIAIVSTFFFLLQVIGSIAFSRYSDRLQSHDEARQSLNQLLEESQNSDNNSGDERYIQLSCRNCGRFSDKKCSHCGSGNLRDRPFKK